jgi:putative ABC transport system permease protein
VAVAALGMALAAMIGVSVMVASFRESLSDWLTQSMSADLYISAPGLGTEPERRIDPAVLAALSATAGVAGHTETRLIDVPSEDGSLTVTAVQRRTGATSRPLLPGTSAHVWDEMDGGGLVISEPLSWRLKRGRGDHLTLVTADGPRAFPIAGVFRDYGTGRGSMLMSLATYRRFWHDDSVTGIAVYLAPGAQLRQVSAALRAASRGRQALLIRSDAELRAMSMSIFDRTFVITRVLNWLAAGVAAVGLVSSLLAWELERSHELAILRSLGLTPRGAALLIELQTGFMGLAALVAAIPAGLLTALVLTDVINRRAFGWHIDMHVGADQIASALWLALAAALAAGLYPAWRTARAPIAADIREE